MPAVSWLLTELNAAVAERSAGRLQAAIEGAANAAVSGVASLSSASSTDLTFLISPIYRADAASTRAGAIVLSVAEHAALQPTASARTSCSPAIVICEKPFAWFAHAAQLLHPAPAVQGGIANGAHVAADAHVDASAQVDAGATVSAGATLGAGAWIGAGAFIGERAAIGNHTRIYPRAVVLDDCKVGMRCIVHSGAVIGGDGFGFAPLDGHWVKVPQVGSVVIGDDVEIGANTTIDRGAMGDTIIEDGVKLDNQIQIAHNCVIGAHTVIAACVGIAGSAKIGRGCRIGGAAMIGGHLVIADGSDIGPATPVPSSVNQAGHYTAFFPLMKHRDWERAAAVIRNLPELRSRVRQLESERKAAEAKPE